MKKEFENPVITILDTEEKEILTSSGIFTPVGSYGDSNWHEA